VDRGVADGGGELPVALLRLRVLAPPELEDDELLALALAEHLADDRRAGNHGLADLCALLVAEDQDLVEAHLGLGLEVLAIDEDAIALAHRELPAAVANHRVHD